MSRRWGNAGRNIETEQVPFPTLQLMQSYVEDVRRSIRNPGLQESQLNFLMTNITMLLKAFKAADEANSTLSRDLKTLQEKHAVVQKRCSLTHDNNIWLDQRFNEVRNTNDNLANANSQLEYDLSLSKERENNYLDRIRWMEETIRKPSGFKIKQNLLARSDKLIEMYVNQGLSTAIVNSVKENKSVVGSCRDGRDGSCSQIKKMVNSMNNPGEESDGSASVGTVIIIKPVTPIGKGRHGASSVVAESVFDHNATMTQDNDTMSMAASDMSMFTDVYGRNAVKNKMARESIVFAGETEVIRVNTQNGSSNSKILHARSMENDVPTKAPTRISIFGPEESKAKTISTVSSLEADSDSEDENSKALAVRAQSSWPEFRNNRQSYRPQQHLSNNRSRKPFISPSADNFRYTDVSWMAEKFADDVKCTDIARMPDTWADNVKYADIAWMPDTWADNVKYTDIVRMPDTSADNVRYADIARVPGSYARAASPTSSINPQIHIADPYEVAGPWNDVPVPEELRRLAQTERHLSITGLPSTATVSVVAKFVRGGKIERIILRKDRKTNTRVAQVSFFSQDAARDLFRWMSESPRIVVDDHVLTPYLNVISPPPEIPRSGGSRAILTRNMYPQIETKEHLADLMFKVARKNKCEITIERTGVWKIPPGEEQEGIMGQVVFGSYRMGLQMTEILVRKLGWLARPCVDLCEYALKEERVFSSTELEKEGSKIEGDGDGGDGGGSYESSKEGSYSNGEESD